MKSTADNPRLQSFLSLDFSSHRSAQHDDTRSYSSLNLESPSKSHYAASHSTTRPSYRLSFSRRPSNAIESYRNSFIINGSLFDEQLFQVARSSYVTDYASTPHDWNRFLEGHATISPASQLDAHLYKLAFIITLSEWYVDKELLLSYYPHDEDEGKILEELSPYKRFCFPELNPKQKNGGQVVNDQSTYVFTRTLSNGQVEYGYCRRLAKEHNQMTKFPLVICIVSTHAYFKLYDAVLTELAKAYISNEAECNFLMQCFYSKPIPTPAVNSSGVTCILDERRIFFYVCPRDDRLNHDYYSTLLSCLSPYQIIYLFESVLRSKRILLFSQYPSKLTKCSLGLSSLLYPFAWPFSFTSLMPSSWLSDLLDSPCPYIYGCLDDAKQQISKAADQDALIVDLDAGAIDGDLVTSYFLPFNLRQTLELSLEYVSRFRLMKTSSTLINIAVSEAFLHVFTELLYRLPDFYKPDQPLTNTDRHHSVCSDFLPRRDSGIDLQSLVSVDVPPVTTEPKRDENPLGYEFDSEEFLRVQSNASYTIFLKEFITGMLFLKFLDDYQPDDEQNFPLFTRRLHERRQMTLDNLAIDPLLRFRQTFDLLEKQMKLTAKPANPSFSKFLKKIFE